MFSTYAKLVTGFRAAGVPLEFMAGTGGTQIFRMDIQSEGPKGERVRVGLGSRPDQIAVLDRDAGWGQVLLRMQEPRRQFRHRIPRPTLALRDRTLAALARSNSRLLREEENQWLVESWTPGTPRQFLIGYDDVRLFISQVKRGDTVSEAHSALKPDEVRDAELRWPGAVSRQGEWFFVPIRPQDRVALGRAPELIRRGWGIETTRRPHVASERAEFDGRVFVRGTMTHPDHHPVHLQEWRRAVRNSAILAQAWMGLEWVD